MEINKRRDEYMRDVVKKRSEKGTKRQGAKGI